MITRRLLSIFLVLFLTALAAGCGGNTGGGNPPPGATANVTVGVTDAPPPRVTIISFEALITGATLNPGNVSLVNTPTKIEVKRLETETAFLSALNVQAGTYNSITVTFGASELTFKNDTAAPIPIPGGSCAVLAVCEVKNIPGGSVTYSGAPFSVTIIANTPTGFIVDVNLNNLITAALGLDFNAANAVVILQVNATNGVYREIGEDITGVVANKSTNQFTLQTASGNFTVNVDNNTVYEDFSACTGFACVNNLQVVEVSYSAMTGSGGAVTFLAKKIELEDNAADDELEGVITNVTDATHFDMVLTEELRDVAGVEVGNPITVTLDTVTPGFFRVDTNGLTIPAGLLGAFEGASNTNQLIPGQTVQVRKSGGTGTNVTTNRVRLRMSRLTGKVANPIASPNFNVDNLPSIFGGAIVVETQASTEFEGGITGVSGLAVGNTVSLRGLYFKSTPNNHLIASKVRKRTP